MELTRLFVERLGPDNVRYAAGAEESTTVHLTYGRRACSDATGRKVEQLHGHRAHRGAVTAGTASVLPATGHDRRDGGDGHHDTEHQAGEGRGERRCGRPGDADAAA